MGPISSPSASGNRYVLTLSDYFTKWVEAIPLPTKEAHGVGKELLKVIVLVIIVISFPGIKCALWVKPVLVLVLVM